MIEEDRPGQKYALIVEDEPAIARACRKVLGAEGFVVDLAYNGLIAKELLSAKKYDLCLSDIRLPGMNGVDLYKHIEQEYPGLAARVIFTTGDLLSSDIGIFIKETGRPFLLKPFTPDELRNILNKF